MTSVPTDEILTRLCEAINDGMNRFEETGQTYASIIEKHRDAVNEAMHGKDASEIRDRRAEAGREGRR